MYGIEAQYRDILRNWGQEAADRYLQITHQHQKEDNPPRQGRWWVSNRQHQPRRFNAETVSQIRHHLRQGETYAAVANRFGCCKATIHYVAKGKGAYKNYSQQW